VEHQSASARAVVRIRGEQPRVSTSRSAGADGLYAVDVPELVLTFYLDRPVTLFPSYGDLERRGCRRARRLSADRSASLAS